MDFFLFINQSVPLNCFRNLSPLSIRNRLHHILYLGNLLPQDEDEFFIHSLNKKVPRAYHVPDTALSEQSSKKSRQGLLFLVMVKSKKQKKTLEIAERQSTRPLDVLPGSSPFVQW